MWLCNLSEILNIDTKEAEQNRLQEMTGDLGDHASCQAKHSFGQQTFQVTMRVLDFVESSLNPFSNAIQPAVKIG